MSNSLSQLSRPMRIGNVVLRNRVIGAPMSGVSDLPWRRRIVAHGAAAAIAEMSTVERIIAGRDNCGRRREAPQGHLSWVQIAGRDAALMAEAARICEADGADLIDINFGCPAKKVTGGYAGSALMREPALAARLVAAVANAVAIPVTVKMRLGWETGALNAPELARIAVESGAQAITVHGRTRCQYYSGSADWSAVKAVRDAISAPLIVNGDIADAASAARALDVSNADAVMVGRACQGAQWIPGMIASAAGDASAGADVPQSTSALIAYMLQHHEEMLVLHGADTGIRHARKHIAWHLDRFAPGCPVSIRQALVTATRPEALLPLLEDAHGLTGEASSMHRAAA
jgi:tRNA-dihydrouridine synthase B